MSFIENDVSSRNENELSENLASLTFSSHNQTENNSENDKEVEEKTSQNSGNLLLHLSLEEKSQGAPSSRTKKFLESNDTIISQLFTQAILSSGVTPTEETEETFAQQFNEYQTVPNKFDEEECSEKASRLSLLNDQQRPSIVIECFDKTPPVTPDEPALDAFFHTTIVDDEEDFMEDVEKVKIAIGFENNNSEELLMQAVEQYGLADNFTTIEENIDENVSPIENFNLAFLNTCEKNAVSSQFEKNEAGNNH